MIDYCKRGVFAGGVAGVAYGLFIAFVANPLTEYLHHAGHDHGHHAAESARVVAESTTAIVSIGGGLLWAIFLGGVFGLAMFVFEPALPATGTARSYVLAGCGFLTVSATPWLVLPPAAPVAEHLYPVETRLAIYGGLVLVGGAVSAASIESYRRTTARHRLLGVAAGLAPVAGTILILPVVTPTVVTHPGLSTDLVAAYQAMVIVGQAGIWLLIAATFGWLQRRGESSTVAQTPESAPESA